MTYAAGPPLREKDTTYSTSLRLRMEATALDMELRDQAIFTGATEWLNNITFGDGRLRPTVPMEPVCHRGNSTNGRAA